MKLFGKLLASSSLVFMALQSVGANPTDSLRLEIDKNKKKAWIIHKVEAKETLYRLSRRYKVEVEEITKENPNAKSLRVNDILRIPYKDFEKQATLTSPQNKAKKHQVETGETLYRISQKYKISVADLQKWNNLAANESIGVGRELWVSKPTTTTTTIDESKETKENKEIKESKEKTVHVVKEDEYPYTIAQKYKVKQTELLEWNSLTQESKLQIGQKLEIYPTGYKKIEENKELKETAEEAALPEITRQTITISGYSKVIEKGTAEILEDDKAGNYTGLHREAPIGTIVAVKNEVNGESVFVRIVGKLPSVGNGKTLIKVSKNVHEALKAKSNKFTVEVSYIP